MSAEPLSREEREAIAAEQRVWPWCEQLDRYEATVQAAEERVRTSEAERFLLRLAILSARDLMGAAHREPRPGIAHDLRVGADKILHDALAADDAARGER